MLQNILDSTKDNDAPYQRGVYAVIRAVKGDFDRMFSPEAWNADVDALRMIAKEYCETNPTKCPICSSDMVVRQGGRGPFKGCSTFPTCKGSRSIDGRTTLNEAVRVFIADKIYEEQIILESHLGRFQGIDLDGD